MIGIRHIMAELIATPARCFTWALLLIIIGGSLASPFTIGRAKVDSGGLPLLSEDGPPIMEVDRLANLLAHWPENLCLLGAIILAGLGVLLWCRRFRERSHSSFSKE
jgi:hypothetical protein